MFLGNSRTFKFLCLAALFFALVDKGLCFYSRKVLFFDRLCDEIISANRQIIGSVTAQTASLEAVFERGDEVSNLDLKALLSAKTLVRTPKSSLIMCVKISLTLREF